MLISDAKRKDIDSCAFLFKCLRDAKYEIVGTDVANYHACFEWVQELAKGLADSWNIQNMKEPPKGVDAPRNVKVTNPSAGI